MAGGLRPGAAVAARGESDGKGGGRCQFVVAEESALMAIGIAASGLLSSTFEPAPGTEVVGRLHGKQPRLPASAHRSRLQ